MNIDEVGTALRAHAHPYAKVRTTSYAAAGARDPEVPALYAKGEFVASLRCRIGSLESLVASVREAGFTVRGTRTANDYHVVIFDAE